MSYSKKIPLHHTDPVEIVDGEDSLYLYWGNCEHRITYGEAIYFGSLLSYLGSRRKPDRRGSARREQERTEPTIAGPATSDRRQGLRRQDDRTEKKLKEQRSGRK